MEATNKIKRIKIKKITIEKQEDVYDITVEKNHNFFANGLLVHNCGEQMLAPGGCCNLGSLNLTQFINEDGSGIDFRKLKKYTRYLVRMLDNVNSYSDAPLPEYVDSMRNKRRIGIGILGWGSALYMLKARFASEEAAKIREDIMETITHTAIEYSVELAAEKGMFKYCDPVKHSQAKFFKQIGIKQSVLDIMANIGIRNSSLFSIQPTGNCQTPDTIIKTKEYGNFSYENILKEQFGKDFDVTKLVDGQVLNLKTPITIKTYEGDEVVNSIFINGYSDIIKLTLNNGDILKQTKNHRYLVKISETTAKWVESKDLAIGMKILGVI